MINFAIPKTSLYVDTLTTFKALFNVPTPGLYDFNVPATNKNLPVLALNPNTIYLINKISVGGTISQEEYLSNIVTVPVMTLGFLTEGQRIYPFPVPIVQFSDGLDATAWFMTDRTGETLTLSLLTGQLSQDANLIGIGSVSLNISLSIFQITDTGYIQEFKEENSRSRIGIRTGVKPINMMVATN